MKFAAACLLLLLTFNKLSAQAEFNQSVLNIMQAQTQAWNKGNIAEFMQGYWNSDSLLFVGKNGPVYGYTTTLVIIRKTIPIQ